MKCLLLPLLAALALPTSVNANIDAEVHKKCLVEIYRKQWSDKKLFTNYPKDGIVVKINSRKLQLIREKSYGTYPFWQTALKF